MAELNGGPWPDGETIPDGRVVYNPPPTESCVAGSCHRVGMPEGYSATRHDKACALYYPPGLPPTLKVALDWVADERKRQDRGWGDVITRRAEGLTLERWLTILVEEVGEVAEAILEDAPRDELASELAQVAAVAVAALEHLQIDVAQDELGADPPAPIRIGSLEVTPERWEEFLAWEAEKDG